MDRSPTETLVGGNDVTTRVPPRLEASRRDIYPRFISGLKNCFFFLFFHFPCVCVARLVGYPGCGGSETEKVRRLGRFEGCVRGIGSMCVHQNTVLSSSRLLTRVFFRCRNTKTLSLPSTELCFAQ